MSGPEVDAALTYLTRVAGGYLRSPVRDETTCPVCFTVCRTVGPCPKCRDNLARVTVPNRHGFMIYAGYDVPIRQAGHVMRGYKTPPANTREVTRVVQLLTLVALRRHTSCAGQLAGMPVTRWASVPSLPPKGRLHPFRTIVAALARSGDREVVLEGAESVGDPRRADPSHYRVVAGDPTGRHVLLVDDTWTGGGHMSSAAHALHSAGAAQVSALAIARWMSVGWEDTTAAWLTSRLSGPDWDAEVCPWTGGLCPGTTA